jgi:hypothetical protein
MQSSLKSWVGRVDQVGVLHYKCIIFMQDSLVGETTSKLCIGFSYLNHLYIPMLGPIAKGEEFMCIVLLWPLRHLATYYFVIRSDYFM